MTEQSRRRSGKVRKDTLPLNSKQIAEMEQIYPGFSVWYCTRQHKAQERQAKKEASGE